MTCAESFAPRLRARGLRVTPQRNAILHVLHHAHGHLSPVQVYEQARKEFPRLTEPTVYRTLEDLAEKGILLAAHMGGGRIVYELTEEHHHHLVCRQCGATVEVGHTPLQNLYRQLGAETGYELDSSHVTFFGLCPNCRS